MQLLEWVMTADDCAGLDAAAARPSAEHMSANGLVTVASQPGQSPAAAAILGALAHKQPLQGVNDGMSELQQTVQAQGACCCMLTRC